MSFSLKLTASTLSSQLSALEGAKTSFRLSADSRALVSFCAFLTSFL